MSIEKMISNLSEKGGLVVCTSQLNELQIAQAKACDRIFIDSSGIGYVWLPKYLP